MYDWLTVNAHRRKVHVMTKHSPYEDAEDNYDDPVDCIFYDI